MNPLERLSRGIDRISERVGSAVSWLALLMVLLGAFNALARWGGRFVGKDFSSNGLLEAQWYIFTLLFLLAAAYTLQQNEHVRVDVIYTRLSPRTRAWLDFLGTLLLLIPFCVFAILYTWPGVVESWHVREGSPDPGGLPRYPLKTVVPIAFALVALQGLANLIKAALVLFTNKPPERPAGAMGSGSATGDSGKGAA